MVTFTGPFLASVTGEISGALPASQFQLYKVDDPLLVGESTIAEDYLIIEQVGGVPSGATITVNDEQHVMIGFFEERLKSIGINTATIRVFSEDRVTEYDGPGSATPDFEIIEGTSTYANLSFVARVSLRFFTHTLVIFFLHHLHFPL